MATDSSGSDHQPPSDPVPPTPETPEAPETPEGVDDSIPTEPTPSTDLVERRKRRISIGARILLFTIGWALILIGIAGLVLPGIQGVLTILLGAAILSAVSELIYEWLKRLLKRWPWMLERFERFRDSVRRRFGRE